MNLPPWWDNYTNLNNYFKRLSLVLSSGKQNNDILVLEPTTTAWMYDSYIQDSRNEQMDEVGLSFQSFVTKLEKNQVEYDLGSEDILKNHGTVQGKRFVVGKSSYSKIVIPPLLENLNKPTFQLLLEFARSGGEILSFSTPEIVDGAINEKISNLFAGEYENVTILKELTNAVITENFKNTDLEFEEINGGNFLTAGLVCC